MKTTLLPLKFKILKKEQRKHIGASLKIKEKKWYCFLTALSAFTGGGFPFCYFGYFHFFNLNKS